MSEKEKKSSKSQMKEIAEKLGISIGTVSLVLNGRGDQMRISPKTQERIKEAAKEMNYQPNIYARRLRHAGSGESPYIVALFFRDDNLNSRLGRVVNGIRKNALRQECKIELLVQPYTSGALMEYGEMFSANHISGAVVCGATKEELSWLEKTDARIPIVIFGEKSEKFYSVTMNSYEAGRKCATELYHKDLKSACSIAFPHPGSAQQIHLDGYRDRFEELRVPVLSSVLVEASNYQMGFGAMRELIQKAVFPCACIVMDFRLANGMMKCCNEEGIRVPQDIRLLFFEESELLEYYEPSLSSIDLPSEEMAEMALDLIVKSCEGTEIEEKCISVSPVFYLRDSTKK